VDYETAGFKLIERRNGWSAVSQEQRIWGKLCHTGAPAPAAHRSAAVPFV